MKTRGSIGAVDIVYFAVVLIVGLGVFANINSSITPTLGATTTAQYAAASNVSTNVFSGMTTLANAPTVMAAVVILGVVALLMQRK